MEKIKDHLENAQDRGIVVLYHLLVAAVTHARVVLARRPADRLEQEGLWLEGRRRYLSTQYHISSMFFSPEKQVPPIVSDLESLC